ncbi:MAG: uracil-DNA glycosylase [Ramlibacter sp.]|uniref:uracil-DNA glycosylase n=1 Tax=Ramlibacter sp. TaxID=1917967 RepID=UPI0026079B52|nr:uracil-DNA glycosylase [Ramlibacter sp.]MDB5752931.1 uracil-DNA glycosylase [Ramlibacter sp.]
MSLQLDARQRAMLEEMGVRLFLPAPTLEPPRPAAAPAVRRQPSPVVASPDPAPLPVVRAPVPASSATGPGVEMMEWDALARTVVACRACQLCEGRREPLLGGGDLQADWLIVGEPPNEDEDRAGQPFTGDGGKLLDNMLRALGLTRRDRVYLANVIKCRPGGNGAAGPEEVAHCEAFLRRQVELLKPRVILAMGRLAMQTLLASSEPLGKLRGRAYAYQGVPVIATYHPVYLLRNPADKARAWADLCLAQAIVRGEVPA